MGQIILIGLLAVVVLIVVFCVIVAMKPSYFRIDRTAVMNAPAPAAFAQVNDFHKWEAWSPWAKIDPNAKNSFEGSPSGQGAIFSWDGNNKVGAGRMTILESRPGEFIKIKLEFMRPFACTNTAEFAFKPQGNQTAVTWSMYGNNRFMGKVMGVFMDMDKMLGKEFEKGLAQMKVMAVAGK